MMRFENLCLLLEFLGVRIKVTTLVMVLAVSGFEGTMSLIRVVREFVHEKICAWN